MTTFLLIMHGLFAVALLGALTHQAASLFPRRAAAQAVFVERYARVDGARFTLAIALLYFVVFVLGSVIYPAYRVDVRIPFEELGLFWAVGLFELKEHAGGIGLGILPLYVVVWRRQAGDLLLTNRRMITALLAAVVWFDFVVGHVLNNIRGLG